MLTANGRLFTGAGPLFSGNGTVTVKGGNLNVNESQPVIVNAAGVPPSR